MCSTIGQGITGIATLEIESFATVNANLAGRAGIMNFQYYRAMKDFDLRFVGSIWLLVYRTNLI
jgi:hypothetical protein